MESRHTYTSCGCGKESELTCSPFGDDYLFTYICFNNEHTTPSVVRVCVCVC